MIKSIFLKNLLINTVFKGLSLLNGVIKKDPNTILLYSDTDFRDNTRYLYQHLIENHYNDQYKIICAVKNDQDFAGESVKNVSFVKPMQGVKAYLTSGHVFYSFGKIPIVPGKNQYVMQMWHGTSFKGFAENQTKTNSQKTQFYTHVFASSEYFKPIVQKKFSCAPDRVFVCGHPRTDMLYKTEPKYDLGEFKKIIVWLPTFRKSSFLGMSDGDANMLIPLFDVEDLEQLDTFLAGINVKVIVKLHPAQDVSEINVDRFTHLDLMTHKQFMKNQYDLYALLRHADALVTDYSSVFYDYLLLNRPIGFTEDDVDSYKDSRGFAVDPDAFRPGMRLRTKADFYQFVQLLAEGKDAFQEARNQINCLSNEYQDGHNCERALKASHIERS